MATVGDFGGGDPHAHDNYLGEPLPIMRSERRMNARALSYWETHARDRAMPTIDDCADMDTQAFAGHMAVFDLSGPGRRPRVRQVGDLLAVGVRDRALGTVGDPLGEIVRRLPTIAARGTPVGFEAEFPCIDEADMTLCMRGVLLPLAAATGEMAHVMGVMNWRWWSMEAGEPGDVRAAMTTIDPEAIRSTPVSAWQVEGQDEVRQPDFDHRIAAARTWVALALTDRARADHHRNAALGAIHDATLGTDDLGVHAAVELVFGATDEAASLYVDAILHARRIGLPTGRLTGLLTRQDGPAGWLAALSPARGGHQPASTDQRPMTTFSLKALHTYPSAASHGTLRAIG